MAASIVTTTVPISIPGKDKDVCLTKNKHQFREYSSFGDTPFLVCAPWARSNGCKSVKCPDSGKLIANDKGVYREVESEGSCK